MATTDPDGSVLLTTDAVGALLQAAVEHAGGRLLRWQLAHVDSFPGHSTTATYQSAVEWPYGRRDELLGVSVRAGGLTSADARAGIFADGDREVAVWVYPQDPDLPGLARAAYPEQMAALVNEHHLAGTDEVTASRVTLTMIGYRPRRRAVLRMTISGTGATFYVKVLRPRLFDSILERHNLLREAGVPSPRVAASTSDHLLVLEALPGRPLARAIFDAEDPCTAEAIVDLLDSMPASIGRLERRPPWTDSVSHYAHLVSHALPSETRRLDWMVGRVQSGLAGLPAGDEPTHGDFHEGQVHVAGGRIVGILDVDTIGPGRRADDLACLVAHLSTVQRMNAVQAARVHHLIRTWVPVFDDRVDPAELRLRAAAVIISLATGPYRGQEAHWQRETSAILDAAEALVRQIG